MKPIRILQVLTIMNRGGAETMVMNYYRNIDRSKVQFDFLLHRQERGIFDDEIESLGGKIHRLPGISYFNLIKYKKSLSVFFKNNPEYNTVHSHLNALSYFVLKEAFNNNIKTRIAHSHTSLYKLNLNPFSKEKDSFKFIVKFLVQNLFKRKIPIYATHYYACGFKAGIWLFGKKNRTKIKIINNAIDTNLFLFSSSKSKEIKIKNGLDNKFVIGHVGNFVPEKNHVFIIKVFHEIKKINKNAILVLIGGGNRKYIENLVTEMGIVDSVFFLGVRSDVSELLQAVDVFLFPSKNEGLPVTLIEAQASGLKIFASDEISDELKITDLVEYISLEVPPSEWARQINDSKNYNRKNTFNKIVEGKYDIKNNALLLQQFYLKKNI